MSVALRMSSLYAPTLKEVPAEAELPSHRILLRAGMIRKAAAGVYSYLPLGWRSLHKIEQIVREEMDAIGSQEMLMPAIQPSELWQESGRWELYGPELMRLKDRHGREFCLGPTHEELVTSLVRHEVRSYRELPLSVYQIQVKFRDEVRPRFGLLRGREFIMKDAYSFHATQESLQEHYDAMSRAYARICERLGLAFRPVEAESGQIGGKVTTEFMALAESGEAALVYCECGYAANVEAASTVVKRRPSSDGPKPMRRVHTPGIRTIAELAGFLGVSERQTVKTMAAKTEDGSLVYFCVPGDRELNPVKATWAVPGAVLLDEEDFAAYGVPKGSLGPIAPPADTLVIADRSLENDPTWGVGANENDYHIIDAQPGRDFQIAQWADLVVAEPGDCCSECGARLKGARGIEVSQVFQLGTRYSVAMGATFSDEDGVDKPFLMGCYGVGVSRSLAAVIEQRHDEAGVAWPVTVAPLEVAVLPLTADGEVFEAGERIWRELAEAGVETLLDDRDERAGVKFNDADLIGWPLQVVVGKRGLAEGVVEVKDRASGERVTVPLDEAVAYVVAAIAAAKTALAPLTVHPTA
ncbi:MAG TPA: proline--tRNA ligase [Coriobacteriia bacterium]